jgi:hypothetical protein
MLRNGEENDDENEHNKTSFGFNSTEIIAALSLELMRASEHVRNPITNKPFNLKFGKKYKLIYSNPISKTRLLNANFSLRFSFWNGRRWYCWHTKLSILFIW